MKPQSLIFVLVMLLASGSVWAQQDPILGTWKLNVAKSKYDPGPIQRSLTLKFEPSGANGVKLTTDGVDAQGKPSHTEYTANYDGKDYPIKGSPDADMVSIRRIDVYTRLRVDKKGGSVVRIFRSVLSKDGRTYTSVSIGVNAQGHAFHNIALYDKQ